ncbi:MAG: hypothetical protein JW861_14335 [Bacteroidales bacterium]|nr:hypothetical protein [Bacteroidales bacterium]
MGGAVWGGSSFNDLFIGNYCHAGAPDGNSEAKGGGCYTNCYNCTFINNYVTGNGTVTGGGVYSGAYNSVLWQNTPDQLAGSATYCLVQGGYPGTGNISDDPCFLGSGTHPYSIAAWSPCVDAGDPATNPASLPELDLAGFPRFRDGDGNDTVRIDMGAYEYQPPTIWADFTSDCIIGKTFDTVHFFSECTFVNTLIGSYSWDFNHDGIPDSQEENPIWIYTLPGQYSVELTAIDTSGLVGDTVLKTDYFTACLFEAGFQSDPLCGEAPLQVQFTDTSQILFTEIDTWSWDLDGDGSIDSYEQHPEWIYNDPGQYSVSLFITDTSGLIHDSVKIENCITACLFEAGFLSDLHFGKAPLTVQFTDTSQALFTQAETWQWDFNSDGIIDSNEQYPEWTYDTTGQYTVTLILRDTSGYCVDTLIVPQCITACGLTAEFYADTTSGNIPLTVGFTDACVACFTQAGSWEWDFNDDGIVDSYLQNPTWTYQSNGFYSVTLVVTDTSGTITDTLRKPDYIQAWTAGIGLELSEPGILNIFPNPFSHQVYITFIPASRYCSLVIRDVQGNRVRELKASLLPGEPVTLSWDGCDDRHALCPEGLYFIQLFCGNTTGPVSKCVISR